MKKYSIEISSTLEVLLFHRYHHQVSSSGRGREGWRCVSDFRPVFPTKMFLPVEPHAVRLFRPTIAQRRQAPRRFQPFTLGSIPSALCRGALNTPAVASISSPFCASNLPSPDQLSASKKRPTPGKQSPLHPVSWLRPFVLVPSKLPGTPRRDSFDLLPLPARRRLACLPYFLPHPKSTS